MADADFDFETEHWCAGMRAVASRPLAPAERTALLRLEIAATRRLIAALFGAVLGFTAPLAMLWLVPQIASPFIARVTGWLLIAAAVLLPFLLFVRAQRALRDRRAFRRDLDHGEVVRFAGALEAAELGEDAKRLLDHRLLRAELGTEQGFETTTEAGAVIVTLGRRSGPLRLTVAEVAAAPGYALRVAVPPHLAALCTDPDARFERRALSASEEAEILAHARRLRRPRAVLFVWLVWVAGWIFAARHDPAATFTYVQMHAPWVFFQLGVLAIIVVLHVRALRLAASLEEDTRVGWAMTLHRSTPEAEAPAEDAPSRPVEFLPCSRAVWCRNGRPAPWRNLRKAA